MAQTKFTKALDDFLKEIDTKIFSLKKQLEISQTETKLYKTLLLEEKSQSKDCTTLFVLISPHRGYYESTECIGVFTLESLAIKAILKGINSKELTLNEFSLVRVELKEPISKESLRDSKFSLVAEQPTESVVKVVFYYLDDSSDNDSIVVGIKVNNELHLLFEGYQESEFYYEDFVLDKVVIE